MITTADISSAEARQTTLRREAADARLARIGTEATNPRPSRVTATARYMVQAWSDRRDLGVVGALRNEP